MVEVVVVVVVDVKIPEKMVAGMATIASMGEKRSVFRHRRARRTCLRDITQILSDVVLCSMSLVRDSIL